jgi:hypothetical protein
LQIVLTNHLLTTQAWMVSPFRLATMLRGSGARSGSPEYTRLPWANQSPGAPNPPTAQEFTTLSDFARFERADAMDEIMAQKDEFVSEFMGLLTITPGTHPNTYRVMHLANLMAAFTVMHFKGIYRRRRPSQQLPLLRPPVQVPGHPPNPPNMATSLNGLAARIARNREIAGLHFPTDTEAGVTLAANIFQMIEQDRQRPAPTDPPQQGQQLMPSYALAVQVAQGEWP